MKKYILLVLIIACNVWLCVTLILNKQKYNSKLLLLQSEFSDESKNQVSNAFINTIKYEKTSFLISDSAKANIKKLYSDGSNFKLIYRLSFPYCESCIIPVIDKLISKCPQLCKMDIVIVSAFPMNEYAEEFNRTMKKRNLKIINIPEIDFCLDLNNFYGPYLFIMDSNFHHKYLFFTNKFNFFMLDDYIDFVNRYNKIVS